jgi:hypothetical protein
MKRKSPLGRRAFLAGIGGTAVALPFLELMRPHRASAGGLAHPNRYMVWFSGNSTGMTRDVVVPASTGDAYELTGGLAKFAEHDVRSEISVVSGLLIPWETGGVIPAAGRRRDFHGSMMSALLSGVRSDGGAVRGPTSDQIAADTLGGDAAFRSLELRVQASQYRGGREDEGISYRLEDGSLSRNPPISSPRIAYDALFRTFGAVDEAESERRRLLLEQDKSVIDLVRDDTERLMTQLGREDRLRLERHFDEIRALETRLSLLTPTMGSCALPEDPGEDPAIEIMRAGYSASDVNTAQMGWANEDLRARVMCDLVHMAFVCDLTRVASMMMTFPQSFMSVEPICGVASDLHEMSHGPGSFTTWGQSLAWLTGWFAYVTARLRDTPEGDGSVLDRTGMIFLWEGGWGYDPADDADGHAHSTENMSVLVAGRAGGLRGGTHIRADDMHPVHAINTVLHAVGVDGDLGEVAGEIPGLRAS